MRGYLPILLIVIGCVSGCVVQQEFPLPMTAAQFAQYNSGPALLAYLGQPDASPAVCDQNARGPHLSALDQEGREELVGALVEGRVQPGLWRRCVNALVRSAPRADTAAFVDVVGRSYRALLKNSEFEKSPALQARLGVMQQFYIERTNGISGHAEIQHKLFGDLRRALTAHRLGAEASRRGAELLAIFDLEQGQWNGRRVDLAMLDQLTRAGDEATLRHFADRLPELPLRDEARRRVIRLHIAASAFPEVRANQAVVEERVMKQGVYAISLSENPPRRGSLDMTNVPIRGVLVRQDLWRQTATLFGYGDNRPGVSVLPELHLRSALRVEVQNFSQPVSLCGPPKSLDPTPCIADSEVELGNPTAYLERGGKFRFVDQITMQDVLNLAQLGDRFVLPIRVGGLPLVSLDWQLYYERPKDFFLPGDSAGQDGPKVRNPAKKFLLADTLPRWERRR